MKYLFFDIECSNSFNGIGKMCEFGYVITDENFKIISSYDIPMSPGRGRDDRFHLRDRMKREDVQLAYDEEYYFEQEELPKFYSRIKKLMEDKDTICFAFSMNNDIRYLFDSCNKYHLPGLNYTCYDIQQLAANYLGISGQPNLKKCVDQIVGPHATIGLIEHLSRDDAKMEMMIMEAICELNQIDSKTLLEQSEFAKINSMDFINEVLAARSKRASERELSKYIENAKKIDLDLVENEEYKGKRYGISSRIRKNFYDYKTIVDLIHQSGGIYVTEFEHMDVLIANDEENISFLREKNSDLFKGEYLLLDDFTEMCNGR